MDCKIDGNKILKEMVMTVKIKSRNIMLLKVWFLKTMFYIIHKVTGIAIIVEE